MNKFTNDESEQISNVYKVGGKMPFKKLLKKETNNKRKL